MATKPSRSKHLKRNKAAQKLARYWTRIWAGSITRKMFVSVIIVILIVIGGSYGIARWYMFKHSSEPLRLGTTFVPSYAEEFGLDPHQTLDAILSDLNLKHIRLVSYWNSIETSPGQYDFSGLDWQFDMANKYGAKVSLAIGIRQPRWPECHEPDWIKVDSSHPDQWQPQLYAYMNAVINRYKNNPALDSYQLENEFFMKVFGQCKDFNRYRLDYEFNMVKKADPNHPVIISRSNNWVGIPVGKPVPDEFSVSVYKRVWDATITKRYFEYPQPAWTYATLAGAEEIWSGHNMIVHELQAEPWPPNGLDVVNAPLSEQFKSMNAQRMKNRINYGQATGMRTIDLWGAEWWYWLKEAKGDPSVWNVVKQAATDANTKNQRI